MAAVTVTPATGGSSISADTAGGAYTSLTDPIISEGITADIGVGTIILNAPPGFIFDIGGIAPTILVTRTAGGGPNSRNINGVASGTSLPITSITTTQITFTVTSGTTNGVTNSLTWQNIRARPSAGTPLASGNITKSGTSLISGVTDGTTNFGTLTEIAGAKTQLVITTQPSSSATTATDFGTKPIVAVRDQFGNTVTADNVTAITYTAVLSTAVCGGTAGSGTLTSTPPSGAAVSSGVMTYTAMQYSAAESIKICFSSSGITSALSNAIVVNVANIAPATPVNTAPANGAIINNTLTPALSASAFSDPDFDLFAASQWQVTTIPGNYTSPVWDSGPTGPAITTVTVGTALSNDTTYYWHVRYQDSAGLFSAYSSETSFTIANIAPNTPLNIAPSASSTVTTLTPLLEGSTYSDPEINAHSGTQWQIAQAADFISPVFNFTSLTGEISRAVPPNILSNFTNYYWRVRYQDNFVSDHWSNYSSPTGFTIAISSIAVKIQPIAGKTDFFAGDTVPMDVQVINFSTGSPINDAITIISIYNPSGTKIVNQQVMNYISGSNGIYRFSFTIPSTDGVYLYEVKAEKGGQSGFGAANFQVGTMAIMASEVSIIKSDVVIIKTAQQQAAKVTASDVSELQSGKTYRLKIWVEDFESNPVDAFAVPTVTLYDGVRNIVVASSSMAKLSTGTYEFIYFTNSGQVQGLWEASVFVPLSSAKTANRSDFFQLLGSPAQVKINSISDNTVPSIAANIIITNEGGAPFEYQYEYCIIAEQLNQCGGSDDVAYALAAKLINPGQDFVTDLTLTVPGPGDYFFKIVVYWGTERSGASKQFTAIAEVGGPAPIPTPTPVTISGGGGPRFLISEVPPTVTKAPSIWDIILERIKDILNLIFAANKKITEIERRVANLESVTKKLVPIVVPREEILVPEKRIPLRIRLE